ncbi:MAG: nucleotidyltransferase family protein, partial [Nitrososphaerales archaeon]
MQAVVLAGGEGSRLRPLTSTRPKPLVSIVNRPILWHVLRLLNKHNIKESYVTLHYLSDQITTAFSNEKEIGVNINYSFEDRPLGTAGSVKAIQDELKDTFLVIAGDVMTDFDLTELITFHKKRGALVTIGLARVPNPLEYGIVLTEEDGKVS